MGRLPKSTVVAEDSPKVEDVIEIKSDPDTLPLAAEPIFDDILPPERERDIPALDEDLTPEQKSLFLKLLRKEMTLEERAKQLAKLARLAGNKTAAVGLRALQTMNELEGWSEPESGEAPPMFKLPEGAQMAVAIKTPEK